MDLGQIADRVSFYLAREGVSEVPDLIRSLAAEAVTEWAERALWPPPRPGRRGVGRPHNWTFLQATDSFTCAVGVSEETLPTDFLRPVRLVLTVDESGVRPELGEYNYLVERWLGSSNGTPEDYAIDASGGNLVMFPPPDDTYAASFRYMKRLTALGNDGDSNTFTERYPQGIIAQATAAALRGLRQHAEAGSWEEEAYSNLASALAEDRSIMGEPDMVVFVTPNVHGTRENPRPLMDTLTVRRIDPTDP